MKKISKVLCLFLLFLFAYTPVFAQPATGSWDSSSFAPGFWYEILKGGQQGAVGNELGAKSEDSIIGDIFLLLGATLQKVEQIGTPDPPYKLFFEYLTCYAGGEATLFNQKELPWYNSDGSDGMPFVADLGVTKVVTKKFVDENGDGTDLMEFFVTTSAQFRDYPDFSAKILAKYQGTPVITIPDSNSGLDEDDRIMSGPLDFVQITIQGPSDEPPDHETGEAVVDIKPGSCKNPFNVRSRGVLPVAVLGAPDFDVWDVDPVTLMLEGVPAIRSAIEDIGSASSGKPSCDDASSDGIDDLVIKFDVQEIVESLGDEIEDGDVIELTLTGELMNGTPFTGSDQIRIINKNTENGKPEKPEKKDKPKKKDKKDRPDKKDKNGKKNNKNFKK